MSDPNPSIIEVRTYFVRERNALVARADFEPLYIDYYLHHADHAIQYTMEHDAMLKEILAAFTLHLASRPQDETCGWTLNFHAPLVNIFVTGSSRPGRVVGRIFTDDVRDFGKNIFISQVTRNSESPRQSMVEFSDEDIFKTVETYYQQSEQRLARLFRQEDEDIVMISAQPDCDEKWLGSLTAEDMRTLDQKETLSLLEKRSYIWECGCSVDRLYPVLAKLSANDVEEVFGNEEIITLTCPRCGARHRAAKEHFEAWRAHF